MKRKKELLYFNFQYIGFYVICFVVNYKNVMMRGISCFKEVFLQGQIMVILIKLVLLGDILNYLFLFNIKEFR